MRHLRKSAIGQLQVLLSMCRNGYGPQGERLQCARPNQELQCTAAGGRLNADLGNRITGSSLGKRWVSLAR